MLRPLFRSRRTQVSDGTSFPIMIPFLGYPVFWLADRSCPYLLYLASTALGRNHHDGNGPTIVPTILPRFSPPGGS